MKPTGTNLPRRILGRIMITAPASRFASHTLPILDRLTLRFSRGRHTLLGLISGLLVVQLTTTGAKSGIQRTVQVVAVPERDRIIAIASNHGQKKHPGWYYNLLENPRASIIQDRNTCEVSAYEAIGEERENLWQWCIQTFPLWEVYDHRTSRHLPVMVLEPVEK